MEDIEYIINYTPVDGQTVAASGTYTSDAIRLGWGDDQKIQPLGYFSAQITVSGSGTIQAQYLCSNDGETFVVPESAANIVTGMTAGTKLARFSPPVCSYIKILITETGTSDTADVSVVLAVQ